ncbi:MAG TPA: cyclic nucleotide-binding domain-containing protein [Solirubrobacteraceae bacterium]|nr:cyclic nucleotide-binding domain-containing protein [Solirubrobacteraceae bacterium]
MQRRSIGRDGAERLGAIHLFSGLSEGQRQMLARLIDEVSADAGEELMREGEYGYEVLFVEEGSAEVTQGGTPINTVVAGELIGELAVLDAGGTRTATVLASTPLRAVSLTSHFMHDVRRRMPEIAQAIERAAAEHRERDRLRAAGEPQG